MMAWPVPAAAQNKVRDKRFEWKVLVTDHFNIHFYDEDVEVRAREVGSWLEKAYMRISGLLGVEVRHRSPVFLYRCHNEFEQTNLYPGVPEGVGAFAEGLRDRIVLPLYPSERYMQRVLEHELTHVITFSSLYSFRIPSYPLLKNWLFPEWFMEGIAEHMSPFRDSEVEMRIRDAALDGRLRPLNQLRGFDHLNPHEIREAYDEGACFLDYLERSLGEGSAKALLLAFSKKFPWRTQTVFGAAFGRDFRRVEAAFREHTAAGARKRVEGKGDPGSDSRPLTSTPGFYRVHDRAPRWSPDGGRIAFISDRRELDSIYVMAPDGASQRSLLRFRLNHSVERINRNGTALGWSPDGTRLSFVGEWKNRDYLYVLEADRPRKLERFDLPFDEMRSPDFGPEGGRIVFSGVRAGVSDIYILDLETGKTTQLTSDRPDDDSPRWRPDGKSIIYVSERAAQTDLFMVDPATKQTKRLTDTLSMEREPAWSPDGTKIAYSSDAGGIYNLYVMAPPTGRALRLTDVTGGAFSPTWSPSGDEIAFSYYRHGCMNVYRMKIDLSAEFGTVSREDERAAEYERFFTEPAERYPVQEFEDRLSLEFLLPLYLVNFMDISDLRGDHLLSASLSPYFSTEGFMALGDLTWWNLSGRTDLAASLFAETELTDDTEEREYGLRLFSKYPFDQYRSITVGYQGFREKEFQGETETASGMRSGLFAAFDCDNVIGRGLDAVGGTRFGVGAEWFDEALGSERVSTDWYVELSQYLPLARDQIVALRLRVDRSGGPQPSEFDLAPWVRGISPNTIEGPTGFGASLEYRFPIVRGANIPAMGEFLLLKDFRGYLFADAGFATSNPMEDLFQSFDHPAWHESIGLGLRLDFYILQKIPLMLMAEARKVVGQEEPSYSVGFITAFGAWSALP